MKIINPRFFSLGFFCYISIVIKKQINMKLIKEFKCDLTGDECVIILNAFNKEICVTKQEYLETNL